VRAGAVSLAVAIVLLGTKLAAYLATHSAAILSDALESIVNVVAAGFGLFALRIASRPPDPSHPYGHGKIEFLAAGFEGGMIGVAALLILIESIRRLFVGVELERLGLGILLAGGAGVVNLLLGLYLVRAGKRHESATLVADGKHVLTDVVTTGAALVGLGLVHLLGWEAADPIAAIAAALWILRSGYHLVREAVAGLMDEADPEDVARLTEAMGRVVEPQLRGWDDLRSRHQGRLHLIDVTIFVPATITVDEGHDVADRVEAALERCFPHARATCHVEPAPPPQGSSPP
jgi:cation diffusion facilitator family transporter